MLNLITLKIQEIGIYNLIEIKEGYLAKMSVSCVIPRDFLRSSMIPDTDALIKTTLSTELVHGVWKDTFLGFAKNTKGNFKTVESIVVNNALASSLKDLQELVPSFKSDNMMPFQSPEFIGNISIDGEIIKVYLDHYRLYGDIAITFIQELNMEIMRVATIELIDKMSGDPKLQIDLEYKIKYGGFHTTEYQEFFGFIHNKIVGV